MALLGPWAGFVQPYFNADEFYGVLYGGLANSIAMTHGRLDDANWAGGDEELPTWGIQPGAFAAGAYVPFERWEFCYAKQSGGVGTQAWNIFHPTYTNRFWLPWDAEVILYGFQGWFRQDATRWSSGDPTGIMEYWQLRFQFDGDPQTDMQCTLPHGRDSTGAPGGTGTAWDPGVHNETRWRYVSATGMIQPALGPSSAVAAKEKGYRSLKTRLEGWIAPPDQKSAKLATPSGGLWILAFR